MQFSAKVVSFSVLAGVQTGSGSSQALSQWVPGAFSSG